MKTQFRKITLLLLAVVLLVILIATVACANTATVTFDNNGGSAVEQAVVNVGDLLSKPKDPKKEGYTFGGWFLDKEFSKPWNFAEHTVTEDITLYAKWNKVSDGVNTFTVTFNSNGGSSVASYTGVDKGSFISKPTDPSKQGNVFIGWYKDENCTNEWNFATDKVTSNITLYVKWQSNKVNITFQSNGGSSVDTLFNVDYNSLITEPKAPSRLGYDFDGWYKDTSLTNKWNFTTDRATSTMDLYAKWTPQIVSADNLKFAINADGESYAVIGMDESTATRVVVPEKYNDLPVTEIAENAFADNKTIAEVTLPQSVTVISAGAFSNCTNLAVITMPAVAELGNRAFNGCTSLEAVTLPAMLHSISARAFASCEKLLQIEIPQGVTVLGMSAFDGCVKLASVTLPESLRTVGDGAFAGCVAITDIELPNGITKIEINAFRGCINLQQITIPGTVIEMGNGVFADCAKLSSITFEPSTSSVSAPKLTAIESETFLNCVSLESVSLPSTLTDVGYAAFDGCVKLTSVTMPDSVRSVGYAVFRNCVSLASFNIPVNASSIGDSAFYMCKSLTHITVPQKSISIGANAFYGCESLATVTLSVSAGGADAAAIGVSQIGREAFRNCVSLVSIELPQTVTQIGSGVFYGCTKLRSVTMSPNVTEIPANAFRDCSALETADFLANVTVLGDNAFTNCSSLRSVNLANLTEIPQEAFMHCTQLTGVSSMEKVQIIRSSAFEDCNVLTTVNFEQMTDLQIIENKAFKGASLTSVVIPDSVTRIGLGAFAQCNSLSEITLTFVGAYKDRSSNGNIGYIFGVADPTQNNSYVPVALRFVTVTFDTEIADRAFYGCKNIERLTYTQNIESIGYEAFVDCDKLLTKDNGVYYACNWAVGCDENVENVVVNANVSGIVECIFSLCENLESVTLPATLTKIPERMFYGCIKLTQVNNVAQITEIGSSAFQGCEALVNFPSQWTKLTTIGSNAFLECTALQNITLPATIEEIGYGAFYNCHSVTTVTVAANAKYKAENNCLIEVTDNGNILILGAGNTIPAGVTEIGEGAFLNRTDLQQVTIPSSVRKIGNGAFSNATNLTQVTFESPILSVIEDNAFSQCRKLSSISLPNVAYIGSAAFIDCVALTSITVPATVKTLGVGVFSGCIGLQSISFANGISLEEIPANACANCESLTEIEIPASVKTISNNAFSGCGSLVNVMFTANSQIERIGEHTFFNCVELAAIELPATLTNIGKAAFEGCEKLVNVTLINTDGWKIVSSNGAYNNIGDDLTKANEVAELLTGSLCQYEWRIYDVEEEQ